MTEMILRDIVWSQTLFILKKYEKMEDVESVDNETAKYE